MRNKKPTTWAVKKSSEKPKERIMGIGGVFFRATNSKKLADWYHRHLGIPVKEGAAVFAWRGSEDPKRKGHTVWAIFPADTEYFGKKTQAVMINYRVKSLENTLRELKKERVKVLKKIERTSYGKFGWITDPEGNRIELWEPPRNYRTTERQFPSA